MEGKVLTEGYIKGYEDCLKEMMVATNTAIKKHDNGTPLGIMKAFNEVTGTLYFQQVNLSILHDELHRQLDELPGVYDEEACTCDTCTSQDTGTVIGYVVKDGKIFEVIKGGR